MLKFSMPTLLMLLLSSSAVFAGFSDNLNSLLQSSASNEEKISEIIKLVKEAPETHAEKNMALFMLLMAPSCFSREEAIQLMQEVTQLEQPSPSSYASFSTPSEPTFNERLGALVYSSANAEDKISGIIELVREDQTIPYEEKFEALTSYFFPGSTFPDSRRLFQEITRLNPKAILSHLSNPSSSLNTGTLDADIQAAIYEELLNQELNLEEHLTILKKLSFSTSEHSLSTSVRAFNEYLNLKRRYQAPFLPQSFYLVESPEDLIAELYASHLAKSVPYILNEETLNLNLKERLEFANRYKYDALSGNRYASFEIPESLITFYKRAASCKDDQLTDGEKFSAMERLLELSGSEAKPLLIASLRDSEIPFELKHKLAHLAKHASDPELQGEGRLFIDENMEAISTAARTHYDGLSVHSKIDIPPHLKEAKLGQNIGVAVCDGGFFKVLPTSLWPSFDPHQLHLLKQYGGDDKSFSWNLLHGDRVNSPHIHDNEWLSEVKNPSLPYHGSEMTDLVATASPGAHIQPVIVDTNSSESLKAAFDRLAGDPSIHIISCSFGLPKDPSGFYLVSSDVKDSMLKCLRNNKIIVLGATNNGATIPDMPGQPDHSSGLSSTIYNGGDLADMFFEHEVAHLPSRISSLFSGEDETSPLFLNLILVGSSKADSFDLHEKSVKPGNGPAQKQFVYADADNLKNFFDVAPAWGGTSTATAMVSGILADLWSQVKNPDDNTATRVSRCLLENTDVAPEIPLASRGRGKVNLTKALEKLDEY
ncbi:MAG: S8/S53 family peptidase [Alphaproteobacteria bacterium]|nr:S8/S53 family peptidase [Alphaproteobacteria bacterium]